MAIHPATGPDPPPNAHSLSFPAAHYARLFPREYLQAHLASGARPSGRSPAAARPLTVHTGSLAHAQGSAVVRLGDTAAVCGVRAETLHAADITLGPRTRQWLQRAAARPDAADVDLPPPSPDGEDGARDGEAALAELGLLVPNIELNTGCHPNYLPGSAPSVLAQSLTQRLITLLRLTRLLEPAQLVIWHDSDAPGADGVPSGADAMDLESPVEATGAKAASPRRPAAFWTLYIDVLLLSMNGAVFPAIWAAVLAALCTAVLPRARWDTDRACVLCDPDFDRAWRLEVRGLPVALAFAVIEPPADPGGQQERAAAQPVVLVDPDDFEESCCPETAMVVVDEAGRKIWRIEKSGGGAVQPAMVRELVRLAGTQWEDWRQVLEPLSGLQKSGTG